MIKLIGTYECKSDAKGRVVFPAGFKSQLDNQIVSEFVLKRSVFQKCIELYTMEEWNKVMEQIAKLNRFVKKNNDFVRLFTAGVKKIELDASGRFLISKDLLLYAGIKKEVVMSSVVGVVEIWSKELYEKAIEDTMEDFGELAEQVMGGLNIEKDGVS